MRKLLGKAIRYNWDSHCANPVNLGAATFGMVINNILFLFGMWVMLFAGKSENRHLLVYYIALCGIVATGWGLVHVFLGGLRVLGDFIDQGTLEPMLAAPRSPLLLAGISRMFPAAFGDLIEGIIIFGILLWLGDLGVVLRYCAAVICSALGMAGVFILAGAISFFVDRGANVGHVLIEMTLSLSSYPTGKLFTDQGRFLLYLTPAAATALFPVDMVERAGFGPFAAGFLISSGFLAFSVWIFLRGLKHYRAMNYVGARS